MKKIPVWKNIVLIVSTLAILVIATLAWFYSGTRGSGNNFAQDIEEASFIKISSDDGEHWTEDLDMELGMRKDFKEISGNGIDFYAPVYDVLETTTGGLTAEIVTFEKVTDNTNYYEQIFTFQSDADYEVYLAPESYVTAAQAGNGNIDGAIRVAFIELDENGNETLKCIWAPNSTVEYSVNTGSFNRNGSVEENYYYQKSTTPVDVNSLTDEEINPHVVKIPTFDPESTEEIPTCGYVQEQKFMWSDGENLPENAPSLLTIHREAGEFLGVRKMKIRVWLEGYDRECVSLLSGQEFTMKFQFHASKGE